MIPLTYTNSQTNSQYSEDENKYFVEEEVEAIDESQSSSLGSFKGNLRNLTSVSGSKINSDSQSSKQSIESETYTGSSSSSSSTSRTSINVSFIRTV